MSKCTAIICYFYYAGLYDQEAVDDLLRECAKMTEVDHPNILKLKGVCLDGGTAPYIILPFMSNGSLLSFLRNEKDKLVLTTSESCQDEKVGKHNTYSTNINYIVKFIWTCLLYTSPSPRDQRGSRMPSSA